MGFEPIDSHIRQLATHKGFLIGKGKEDQREHALRKGNMDRDYMDLHATSKRSVIEIIGT